MEGGQGKTTKAKTTILVSIITSLSEHVGPGFDLWHFTRSINVERISMTTISTSEVYLSPPFFFLAML
jgi:hypothetical protein